MKNTTIELTPEELLYVYAALNAMCCEAWELSSQEDANAVCKALLIQDRADVLALLRRLMALLEKTEV